jgi:dUTP pyrophosphatase
MSAPLRVRLIDPRAIVPTRAYPDDAGLDLHSVEEGILPPGHRASVGTGISLEIPFGCAGLVLPRSGLAERHGIALVNSPGLIDAGYRGEIRVLLLNTDPEQPFTVSVGDRIAQLVLVAVETSPVIEVEELTISERGVGGFGSSGM